MTHTEPTPEPMAEDYASAERVLEQQQQPQAGTAADFFAGKRMATPSPLRQDENVSAWRGLLFPKFPDAPQRQDDGR